MAANIGDQTVKALAEGKKGPIKIKELDLVGVSASASEEGGGYVCGRGCRSPPTTQCSTPYQIISERF